MPSEGLNYSRLPDEVGRSRVRVRVVSVLVVAFAILTFLDCIYIEVVNYRAGSILPIRPRPTTTWRILTTSERAYRASVIEPTGDPLWQTRPLTPAEQAGYILWEEPRERRNAVDGAVFSVCLLTPLIALVLIGAIVAFFAEHSFKWRIAVVLAILSQLAAITTIVRLDLWGANRF